MKPKKDGKSALDPLPVIRASIGRKECKTDQPIPAGVETCPTRERKKKLPYLGEKTSSNNLMNIIQNTSGYITRLVCIQTAARAA